jgi:hypothetical protein
MPKISVGGLKKEDFRISPVICPHVRLFAVFGKRDTLHFVQFSLSFL